MQKKWEIEKTKFSNFDTQNKILWMSNKIFMLTIYCREFYNDGSCQNLKRVNELLHRLSSEQIKVISGSDQCMPDDVLLEILYSECDQLGINLLN